MEPADSIRRLGFSRWYERRLIEGHAWFVSCFFCMIAIAACMEELNFKGSLPRLMFYVSLVLSSAAIGVYGFWRYQSILVEAETLGENATCPHCGIYARFRLVSATEARCRRCERQWRLIVPD
jgi:hypothetical protein